MNNLKYLFATNRKENIHMSKANNTLKKGKNQYHHLKEEDRVVIQTLVNQKDSNGKRLFNNTYIANYLGVNRSTISRELRNRKSYRFMVRSGKTIEKPYNATDAQNDYLFKRGLSKGEYILKKYPIMAKFIEDKIKHDKWAPDAIVGFMKVHGHFLKDGFSSISTPTIYNAIRHGIIDVKLEHTRRMKDIPDYKYHNNSLPASKIPYSIETRPYEINSRQVFGHFELDTVLSKKNGQHHCLLTFTERKTRFEIILRLSSKSSSEVVNKINQLKSFFNKHYDKVFKSFSTDNGSEFSDFLNIISNSKTKLYFCHPYCSGEKGSNEKHNSMIRYFIPKGTLIETVSDQQLNQITSWMNNYPRKILNYKTPLEALLEEFDDKSIINKFYKLQDKVNCI